MNAHLQSEEFKDLLSGIARAETQAHLAACPQCRTELDTLRQTLAEFRGAALHWSADAAREITLPKKSRTISVWSRPSWALAAATMVLAVALPFSLWRGHVRKAAADEQAQIDRDNQLLAHIDSEIGKSTPTPMQPLQTNFK